MWRAVITDSGNRLVSKTIRGTSINIIEAKAGTGTVDESQLSRQKDILSKKQDLKIHKIQTIGFSTIINVILENKFLTESYELNQVGFYANDPDLGRILFAIAQNTDSRNIPSNSINPNYDFSFDFRFTFESDTSIKATIVDGYNFKGSCTYAQLPADAMQFDFWYCTDKSENYAWNGNSWNPIGKGLESMNFKGSCNYSDLPIEKSIGDYWHCIDRSENYAWNGYQWCYVGKIACGLYFKGECSYENLPSDAKVNDFWYCTDKSENYAWNGTSWHSLGKVNHTQVDDLNRKLDNKKPVTAKEDSNGDLHVSGDLFDKDRKGNAIKIGGDLIVGGETVYLEENSIDYAINRAYNMLYQKIKKIERDLTSLM